MMSESTLVEVSWWVTAHQVSWKRGLDLAYRLFFDLYRWLWTNVASHFHPFDWAMVDIHWLSEDGFDTLLNSKKPLMQMPRGYHLSVSLSLYVSLSLSLAHPLSRSISVSLSLCLSLSLSLSLSRSLSFSSLSHSLHHRSLFGVFWVHIQIVWVKTGIFNTQITLNETAGRALGSTSRQSSKP